MFINGNHTDEIEKKGYLVLNLFSETDISSLSEISNELQHDFEFSGLSYSLMQPDTKKKKIDSGQINTIIRNGLSSIMEDFSIFGESFIVKWSGKKEEFFLHQDWSYTDEEEFRDCYTLWIPLQETLINNGSMFVLPGSHTYFKNYRSATLGTARISISDSPTLLPKLTSIEMKIGQALLFKQALFHGSHPNISDTNRWCAVAVIKKVDVPLYYYQKMNENEVARFTVNENLFMNDLKLVSQGNNPTEYDSINIIPYKHLHITEELLFNKIVGK